MFSTAAACFSYRDPTSCRTVMSDKRPGRRSKVSSDLPVRFVTGGSEDFLRHPFRMASPFLSGSRSMTII
ncbi:hypothetical protein PCANC_25925 [Puccinia coronata f. sp. avenae]|uniref:Uncharacterized protein n=1 Tax=Puccinia coronata f. sp. avenae TaxID=200324 RepID=A0A2N5RXB0_9BASI|nr:hypothetical protein PCANC_27864 [Puccinia coronata f. sp. avenae]PLW25717.1 hypothetical protein PCANC_25925 [Puccinia coronata f. sp. avenae]